MESIVKWLRQYISPIFLALLLASFVLWYIAKLNYAYTTEQLMHVNVDGEEFDVTCVVEGVGTNLFGYKVYMNKTLRIPLTELRYKRSHEEEHEGQLIIDPQSLQDALSMRFSDIKIVSIGSVPEIDTPNPSSL
ncbi:MAG: hypothetical protein RRZ83_03695 [Alistipes sp.]